MMCFQVSITYFFDNTLLHLKCLLNNYKANECKYLTTLFFKFLKMIRDSSIKPDSGDDVYLGCDSHTDCIHECTWVLPQGEQCK